MPIFSVLPMPRPLPPPREPELAQDASYFAASASTASFVRTSTGQPSHRDVRVESGHFLRQTPFKGFGSTASGLAREEPRPAVFCLHPFLPCLSRQVRQSR